MALRLSSLDDLAAQGFDAVIDARSPSEYAEDHLPGAISLPVLDDQERARIGTIYKQQSPFVARKLGAAMVARNVAAHLEGPLAEMPGGWRPLVYCWRGGQRSGAFATILSQVGWRAEVLEGGYKSWRGLVVEALHRRELALRLVVLDGNTGTAKTEILAELAAHGCQAVDLEGLANHRGSLFGNFPEGQPAQKGFETRLAMALAGKDPARPVVVEAESSKIGNVALPKHLWVAMGRAPRIRISAPLEARADYLVRRYGDLSADAGRLADTVERLRALHPAEVIETWLAQAASGDFRGLARDLMARHYDPRYARHRARFAAARERVIEVASLDGAAVGELAAQVAKAAGEMVGGG